MASRMRDSLQSDDLEAICSILENEKKKKNQVSNGCIISLSVRSKIYFLMCKTIKNVTWEKFLMTLVAR